MFFVYFHADEKTPPICWFHFPTCSPQPGQGQGKPRDRNSSLISHLGVRDTCTWAIHCCLPRIMLSGSWIKSGEARTPTSHFRTGWRCSQSDLTPCSGNTEGKFSEFTPVIMFHLALDHDHEYTTILYIMHIWESKHTQSFFCVTTILDKCKALLNNTLQEQ